MEKLLTVEEVAQILRIGRTRAWGLVMSGEIASVKIGRSRRVEPQAVEEYVARLGAR
jgi:excisionase family DNA binding protein